MDSAQLGKIFSGSSVGGGSMPAGQPPNASTHDFARSSSMVLDPRRCLPTDTFTMAEVAKFGSSVPSASNPGSLFVSTPEVIAYSIREGSIRLIHRSSGKRVLLKTHSAGITDMCFTRPTDLVTCAEDGLVIFWSVSLPHTNDDGEEETEFTVSETLRILCPFTPRRVVAYPTNYRTLFIAHGDEMVGIVANRACWEAYSSLPDKSVGLALDQIAQMRFLPGAHSLPVNDMSFDKSGELMVTGSEDGTVVIWDLNRPKDGMVSPLRKIDLNGESVSFVRLFASSNLLVGFTQSNTMRIVNTRTNNGQVLAEVSFMVQHGDQPQLRAQLVNQDYVLLCDSVNPFVVLVQIDEHYFFRRAVALQVPQPILNFSLTPGQDLDVVHVNAISAGLVHTLELPSIQSCFQVVTGGMLPPHHLPPPPPPPSYQATGFFQPPPPPQSSSQQRMASPLPTVVAQSRSSSPPSENGGGEESDALSSKMDELFERLEASAMERQQRDNERINKLLEVISRTLRDLPRKVVEDTLKSFSSPPFQEAVGQVVQAKLAEFAGSGVGGVGGNATGGAGVNAQNKAMEKAMRTVLPGVLDKFAEQTAAQVALKLGGTRALEDAMITRLVPAFEAGVRDLMAQFEDYYSTGVAANAGGSGRSPSQSARKDGNSSGSGAQMMGTPEKRQMCEEQVELALSCGDVVKALQLAVEFPALLVNTCDRINLSQHLLPDDHGFSQRLLVRLLTAIASAPTTYFAKMENGASKKLEWIWAVTSALDSDADEIALELPKAASLAKEELLREQHLFPLRSTRFGIVIHTLTDMAM
ncbi:hypothetical protein BASA81_003704 [Batrachochytrium salamandrivorans]|nr:hypothetical protein BASA81_003704 [Batrachochytrium salamandrivorans]